MVRQKQTKRSLKVNAIYLAATLTSVVFLVVCIIFIGYTGEQGKQETFEFIRSSTLQAKNVADGEIDNTLDTLTLVSSLIDQIDFDDMERLIPYFKQLENNNDFLRAGFIEPDGETDWLDHNGKPAHTADLKDLEILPDVLAGTPSVSNSFKDTLTGVDVICYAVPVWEDGEVTGGLFAISSVNSLRNILDSSLFGGVGFSHIITNTGDYVIRSNDPTQETGSGGLFDIDPPLDADKEAAMRADMAAGNSGYVERDEEGFGESILAAYTPMDRNDWYLFYAVPNTVVSQSTSFMQTGITIIIIVMAVILIALIYMIRKINDKGRDDLEAMAYIDPLTGHSSYQKFLMDAEGLLDHNKNRNYSLWYCDIKNFKYINDQFGYETGDLVLKYWSTILHDDLREGEAFGRVGADNFVCLRVYEDKADLLERYQTDLELLENYHEMAARGYKPEITVGIYLIGSDDQDLSINDMLDRANLAEKSIKNDFGSNYAIFSSTIRDRILYEAEIEKRMDLALAENEFRLYLQPKIDIQHGNRVMGMEALARWDWPGRGLVPPSDFIPIFERNGFIVELDQYMMDKACRYYQKHLMDRADKLVLSVNVSRLCMLRPGFVETYTTIKERYGIPDGCIELEFTESIAFENHELFQRVLQEFRQRGFICALDDFGSGHSSLHLLKTLSLDVLKLDRVFFLPSDDKRRGFALIRSIIDMGITLGMSTVAEGVEDMDQVRELRRMGCDVVQGFIFSRPLPSAEFIPFLESFGKS